jgi:hypothetical protein
LANNENKARYALRWLSERCDGAEAADGAGFSKIDTALGHALAQKDLWSEPELGAALALVQKYRKQLETGELDIAGLDEMRRALEQRAASSGQARQRLRRSDIVTGTVFVHQSGRIAFQTSYHEGLKDEIKQLAGARWDTTQKLWTCDFTGENAVAAEGIAAAYGLPLRKHPEWRKVLPARKLDAEQDRVVIRGINVTRLRETCARLTGFPDQDERVFRAIEIISNTEIALPLRSWVIRGALLWLLRPEVAAQLAWARDEATRIMQEAYPEALRRERAWFSRAAALALPGDDRNRLNLPASIASRLMPHQFVAVQALAERDQVLLVDQQGLGKTAEILAALEATGAWPAVVLCPATARLNWRDEAAAWVPHRKVAVLGGGISKREGGVALAEAELAIVNYESFDAEINGRKSAGWKPAALVADEGQYLKGHGSRRTLAVKEYCKREAIPRIIVASGTPVLNRPSELLTLLTLLPRMLTEMGGFGYFASRYCRATRHGFGLHEYWNYGGADNLGELANRLRETGRFIRRDKASVLPGLAAKQYETIEVEISNRQDYDLAARSLKTWLAGKAATGRRQPKRRDEENHSRIREAAAWAGLDPEDLLLGKEEAHEMLRRIGVLRSLAGTGKIKAAVRWIRNCIKDEKLVVFAYHLEVQDEIVKALRAAGVEVLSIQGDQAAAARRAAIRDFQEGPAPVIVCSLKAAQTAITLTAARRALLVELDWTPAGIEQAEDRIHRIGQGRDVIITRLHAVDTLDDRMIGVLGKKTAAISTLAASSAPHGYKKDGTPRKQPAGPGRPRLPPDERASRRRKTKAEWQALHPDYHRLYMRRRYWRERKPALEMDIADFEDLRRLGFEGMQREQGRFRYTRKDWERDWAGAEARAMKARKLLEKADRVLQLLKDE